MNTSDQTVSDDETEPQLSPGSLSFIGAALFKLLPERRSESAPDDPSVQIDVRDLVWYLAGALPAAKARRIEARAALSKGLRGRIIAIAGVVDEFQHIPWSELAAQSETPGLRGEVAAAWTEFAASTVANAPRARESWIRLGWRNLAERLHDSTADTVGAWTAASTFAANVRSAMRAPVLAAARGADDDALLIVNLSLLPPGTDLQLLSCEITKNGDLEARARLTDSAGRPASLDSTISLLLALRLDDSFWPLETAQLEDGVARWVLTDLGKTFDLPSGALAARYLSIIVAGDTIEPAPASGDRHLIAQFDSGDTRPAGRYARVIISVSRSAHWSDQGALSLDVGIEQADRIAFAAYALELSLMITTRVTQPLGRWPVADWPADSSARTLLISCPGVSTAVTIDDVATALRATLKPLEPDA